MAQLIERLNKLSTVGRTSEGINRPSGSPQDDVARGYVIKWMLDAGLSVTQDNHNNIIGRLPGRGAPIVLGSHIDTVSTAGRFDGVLGVLAAIDACEDLKGMNKHPIDVVVFNDEEDSMSGSIGFCKDAGQIKAFLELHVEQGPVLDARNVDIGVVEGIVGQRRMKFIVKGEENHAGTTPMANRNDALVAAAPIITWVDEEARKYDGLVATVSQLQVFPNVFSVVPGRVEFTLQVRDLSACCMDQFVSDLIAKFGVESEVLHTSEPALCDEIVMSHIRDASESFKLTHHTMPSRASHDAQNFTFCPMGMIFVPSVNGISHSPDEWTTEDMCYNGLRVLTDTVRRIDNEY